MNTLSYLWRQIDGPAVELSNANTIKSSFIAPTASNDTDLQFSLTVKDDKDATSTPATVSVTVKAVTPPATATTGIAASNQTLTDSHSEYSFIRGWGSFVPGTGKYPGGQFHFLTDVAIDPSYNVYTS